MTSRTRAKIRKHKVTELTRETDLWTSIRANAGHFTISAAKACGILSYTLFTARILHSSLDPVYGHVPASRYHNTVVLLALLLSCFTYPHWGAFSRIWARRLAIFPMTAPLIQVYLSRYSEQLGPILGPLLTSLVTTFPLILISGVFASKILAEGAGKVFPAERSYQDRYSGRTIQQAINGAMSLLLYMTSDFVGKPLGEWLRIYIVRSRVVLYFLLASPLAILFPPDYLTCAGALLIQFSLFKFCIPLPYANDMLNHTLNQYGYSLVARQESNTGYISILDNTKDGFRVMRCDHSLLGGEWLAEGSLGSNLREPIYAVFVMLEAVRLVQPGSGRRRAHNGQENALVM